MRVRRAKPELRASAASEPRDRSAPTQRRARERVGESEGRSPSERDWIVGRVGAAAFEQLATGLAGSDLHSVLLEVMQHRARGRTPADVLGQYLRDGFCAPAAIDLRTSHEVDGHLLAAAAGFEALELSPVAPLGVSSAIAQTGQNRVLSALRMTEVVSDPTNVLALECARRLRADWETPVHLATSQRVLRAQPVPKLPGYGQHFRIFVLASGGRETKDHAFTVQTCALQIRTMLVALDRLEQSGYAFGARRVEILTTPARQAVGDRIGESLNVDVVRRALDHAYYSGGLRYQIWVTAPDGAGIPLIDGGAFDWLASLTANRRAVYIASGTGSQLVAWSFKNAGRR